MSPRLVVLSVLLGLGGGALGCYCLSSVLVMGGRSALWLEQHRWIYAVTLAAGCLLAGAASALALWPLGSLGGALALTAAGRYLWLNV